MKFTIDVDCTPQEARSFLGLPDVTPIHDVYVKTMLETMDGTNSIEQMEKLFRSLSPMGDASMKMFQQLMDIGLAGGSRQKNGD
jgi:hypothetical protein